MFAGPYESAVRRFAFRGNRFLYRLERSKCPGWCIEGKGDSLAANFSSSVPARYPVSSHAVIPKSGGRGTMGQWIGSHCYFSLVLLPVGRPATEPIGSDRNKNGCRRNPRRHHRLDCSRRSRRASAPLWSLSGRCRSMATSIRRCAPMMSRRCG